MANSVDLFDIVVEANADADRSSRVQLSSGTFIIKKRKSSGTRTLNL